MLQQHVFWRAFTWYDAKETSHDKVQKHTFHRAQHQSIKALDGQQSWGNKRDLEEMLGTKQRPRQFLNSIIHDCTLGNERMGTKVQWKLLYCLMHAYITPPYARILPCEATNLKNSFKTIKWGNLRHLGLLNWSKEGAKAWVFHGLTCWRVNWTLSILENERMEIKIAHYTTQFSLGIQQPLGVGNKGLFLF